MITGSILPKLLLQASRAGKQERPAPARKARAKAEAWEEAVEAGGLAAAVRAVEAEPADAALKRAGVASAVAAAEERDRDLFGKAGKMPGYPEGMLRNIEEGTMRTLNLYYSSGGNTGKVAERIDRTLEELGAGHTSIRAGSETEVDVLEYDLVFVGSGVYAWLPGKPLLDLLTRLRKGYVQSGAIKPASPKLPGKKAVVYCTYGGAHTGINEAIPAVKYMAQLFDHLGLEVLDEIYVVGEYVPENMREMSRAGRLGDIRGRPDEHDLNEVAERVRGLVRV